MSDSREERIARFLREAKPAASGDTAAVLRSKDLFQDGWMDSLLHVKLLAWIEAEFGKRLPALLASRKNFLTVANIAGMLDKV